MILQEVLQALLAHFCQEQRAALAERRAASDGDHHLVAQVLADGLDLANQLLGSRMQIRVATSVPPILENFALGELLLKDLIGLLQGIAEIGDADVVNGIRGKQGKDLALIARTWSRDFIQLPA